MILNGDVYKERQASGRDQLQELLYTNIPTYYFKRQLRMAIHNRLVRAGKRPMSLELELKKKIVNIKAAFAARKDKTICYFQLRKEKNKIVPLQSPLSLSMHVQKDSLR